MFTPQIVKFENSLESLSSKVQELGRALLTVNGKLDVIAGVLRTNAEWQKKSWSQFEACAKGFVQVRDSRRPTLRVLFKSFWSIPPFFVHLT